MTNSRPAPASAAAGSTGKPAFFATASGAGSASCDTAAFRFTTRLAVSELNARASAAAAPASRLDVALAEGRVDDVGAGTPRRSVAGGVALAAHIDLRTVLPIGTIGIGDRHIERPEGALGKIGKLRNMGWAIRLCDGSSARRTAVFMAANGDDVMATLWGVGGVWRWRSVAIRHSLDASHYMRMLYIYVDAMAQ